jgi:hypothetical protein
MKRTTRRSMLFRKMMTLPDASTGATFLEERASTLFFNDDNPTGQRIVDTTLTIGENDLIFNDSNPIGQRIVDTTLTVGTSGLSFAQDIDELYIPNVFDYIAYWKLEESSGTRQDSSANNRDLSENGGSIVSATGKVGTAAYTENDGRALQWTGSNAFNFATGDYTVMFWCKPRTTLGTAFPIIKAGGASTTTAERGWRLEILNSPIAWNFLHYFSDKTTLVFHYLTDATLDDDLWFFVRFWRRTAGDEHGFQVNLGTKDLKTLASGQAMAVPTTNMFELFRNASSYTGGWFGAIDEVLLYNRYVTDDQAAYVYNSGAGRAL